MVKKWGLSLNKKSFTYLELATTIVIITAISTVMLVSFSHSRQKTRDVRRQADLRNLAAALSWYYTDKLVFPVWTSGCIEDSGASGYPAAFSNPSAGFLGTWMERIPKDPLWKISGPTGYCYYYKTDSAGKNYHLIARMEKDIENKMAQDGGLDNGYYEVFSAGGSELASIGTSFFDVKTKMGGTLTVFSWPVSGEGFNSYTPGGGYTDTSYYSTSPYGVELAASTMSTNLVGYWKMDETYLTNTIVDSAGTNTGTNSGATWKTGANCKYGNCLSFDGNDYIVVGSTTGSLDITGNQITMATWINLDAIVSNKMYILGKQASVTCQYAMFIDDANTRMIKTSMNTGSGCAGSNSAITQSITAGTWYHVAAVYNGSTVAFYWNGVFQDQAARTGNIVHNEAALKLGIEAGWNSQYLNGKLDEVAIWSRALTGSATCASPSDSEICKLYLLGPAGFERAPSGTYLSKIYDSEASSPLSTRWNTISWTRSGEATDTIKFQVRSCLNSDCSDGTWSSDITTSGSSLSVPDNRYFQFKAYFDNGADGTTPYLNSVTIDYQK